MNGVERVGSIGQNRSPDPVLVQWFYPIRSLFDTACGSR